MNVGFSLFGVGSAFTATAQPAAVPGVHLSGRPVQSGQADTPGKRFRTPSIAASFLVTSKGF